MFVDHAADGVANELSLVEPEPVALVDLTDAGQEVFGNLNCRFLLTRGCHMATNGERHTYSLRQRMATMPSPEKVPVPFERVMVKLPKGLHDELAAVLTSEQRWPSRQDFIIDAVREKLDRLEGDGVLKPNHPGSTGARIRK